jgi:hypothetical protein
MRVTIEISGHTERRLSEQAAAAGVDVATLVTQELDAKTRLRMINEIAAPARKAFAESGMTDDELAEELEIIKHQMRGDPRY